MRKKPRQKYIANFEVNKVLMERIELTICLGSSCFARGNQTMVHIIREYLRKNHLEEIVFFKGAHCFNACKQGPTVRINDEYLYGVTPENVIPLLTQSLEKYVIRKR